MTVKAAGISIMSALGGESSCYDSGVSTAEGIIYRVVTSICIILTTSLKEHQHLEHL